MAKVLLPSGDNIGGRSTSAASTNFFMLANGGISAGAVTESGMQVSYRTPGTFSNLYARVSANTVSAVSNIRFRKNTANGNQVLTIPSSTTGDFTDSTNTDSIVPGDLICYAVVAGGAGTSITITNFSSSFSSVTDTALRYVSGNSGGETVNGATRFLPLGGTQLSSQATEANVQMKAKTPGTLKNLMLNVRTNGRTTTTSMGTRIDGVSGSVVVSVGAGITGFLEDSSNSDAVTLDQLINLYVTFGADSNNFRLNDLAIDYITTNAKCLIMSSNASSGIVFNANATVFASIGGLGNQTPETNYSQPMQMPMTLTNLQGFVTANTVVGASVVTLRVNGANGNNTISIGSLTSGYFEDTTHSDVVGITDKVNYSIATGAAGTSLTVSLFAILADVSQSTAYLLMLMGIGL